jgi:malate permease and related proteins
MMIFDKMLIFLILMLVGLLLAKLRIIDEQTSRKLSAIVLYVANPALILNSSQTEHTIPDSQLLTALLIAVAMFALLIAAAAILPGIMRLKQNEANAYAMMTVFSNIGFMGIPLISEIIGSAAVLYASVFILLFNILFYTYGVMIQQRGADSASQIRFSFRRFINPGVISSIIAVTFYLLRVRLPDVFTAPLGYLGNLTAPVSMMIIGATLAGVNIRSFFTDGKLLAFSVLKLLVLPILGGLLLKAFIGAGDLLGVCIVMLSTPVGSMTVMLAQQYGGEYTLLSKGVTLTTLLCVATIPIVFAVLL